MQPQGEFTNTEYREAIRMLSHVITNQVGKKRGSSQEGVDTSSNNKPNVIIGYIHIVEELKKLFEVMHVVKAERIELDA